MYIFGKTEEIGTNFFPTKTSYKQHYKCYVIKLQRKLIIIFLKITYHFFLFSFTMKQETIYMYYTYAGKAIFV